MPRPGRPIGARIRQVCEAVERIEPANAKQVENIVQVGFCNIYKYCERAVYHGLLTKAGDKYKTVADWRERADTWRERNRAEPVARLLTRERGNVWAGLGA